MKTILISIKNQIINLWITLLVCIVMGLFSTVGVLVLSELTLTSMPDLTRDIAAV
jgi:hypothetical protein